MRSERAFTLLETLLALAIGGLLLTAAYAAVVRAAVVRDAAIRQTAGPAAARRALLEMARTLEAAARRPFTADAHMVRVLRPEPEPRLVRYAVDGQRLVETQESAFAIPGSVAAPSRVLLNSVHAFSVKCFEGGAWVDGCRGDAAPPAVELSLQIADGDVLRTRVLLPLGGGG